MRRVLVESPFSGPTPEQEEEHIRYARACIKDALSHGEAPLASHILYTQPGILDDDIPHERQWGIDAGIEWYTVAQGCVVYTDYGISKGMQYGIDRAVKQGIPVEYRTVPGWKTTPSLKDAFASTSAFNHEKTEEQKLRDKVAELEKEIATLKAPKKDDKCGVNGCKIKPLDLKK